MASHYTHLRALKVSNLKLFSVQRFHHLASDGRIFIATQTNKPLKSLSEETGGFHRECKGCSPHKFQMVYSQS